jgi:hypothetical protein
MTTTYTAASLADIATQFEALAAEAQKHAKGAGSQKEIAGHMAEASTWRIAARMLRATKLAPANDGLPAECPNCNWPLNQSKCPHCRCRPCNCAVARQPEGAES